MFTFGNGPMLIGYARVSTDDQNLNLQKDALLEAGCERIFEDRLSGAKSELPSLSETLEYTAHEPLAESALLPTG